MRGRNIAAARSANGGTNPPYAYIPPPPTSTKSTPYKILPPTSATPSHPEVYSARGLNPSRSTPERMQTFFHDQNTPKHPAHIPKAL